MNRSEEKKGIYYAGFSYVIWGFLPIYWKVLNHVSSREILAHRFIWSFVFMIILLLVTRKIRELRQFLVTMRSHPRRLMALTAAACLIAGNWYIYIWAVNENRIIEASLGYYINPLISVLLGVVVLKEKLTSAQVVAFTLAAIGVLILTIKYGTFPWIAILLAFSFGVYGLTKKMILADSTLGLTLETMIMTPFALGYVIYLLFQKQSAFTQDAPTTLLLMGAGIVTAIPLLFFGKGAQKIPLNLLGILQYIAPTLMLILGVLVYDEYFSPTHIVAFLFIWSALLLYSLSRSKLVKTYQIRRKNKISA